MGRGPLTLRWPAIGAAVSGREGMVSITLGIDSGGDAGQSMWSCLWWAGCRAAHSCREGKGRVGCSRCPDGSPASPSRVTASPAEGDAHRKWDWLAADWHQTDVRQGNKPSVRIHSGAGLAGLEFGALLHSTELVLLGIHHPPPRVGSQVQPRGEQGGVAHPQDSRADRQPPSTCWPRPRP
jgi:hypothetical protein